MEKTANFTFKLCFGNEIRRLAAIQGSTTFTELETLAKDITTSTSAPSPAATKSNAAAKLQWTDKDGDVITLRTQSDLDECLAHLAATGTSTLKISLSLPTNTSSAINANTDVNANTDINTNTNTGINANASSNASSNTNTNPSGPPPYTPFAHDPAKLPEAEPIKVDLKIRQHLEKMGEKIKIKEHKWQAELEKLKLDPHYNEKEHLRQLEVLQGAGIATYPLVNMLIAKRIVWNNQKAEQPRRWFSWQGWYSHIWESNDPPRGRWADKLSKMTTPRALQQVQTLREHQMPTGWPIVAYLGKIDQMAIAAKDPVIVSQLEQVKDIQHVPEPLKVKVLLDFNEELACKDERCRRKHSNRREWSGRWW